MKSSKRPRLSSAPNLTGRRVTLSPSPTPCCSGSSSQLCCGALLESRNVLNVKVFLLITAMLLLDAVKSATVKPLQSLVPLLPPQRPMLPLPLLPLMQFGSLGPVGVEDARDAFTEGLSISRQKEK
uniref:Uncharacterized protein n=1 Tax=Molossus molossus TaxID=27622 RepID=A0A7J8HBS7_MOLMO|nr:hypothetical protein HJG59_011162 [Molossus molossus]